MIAALLVAALAAAPPDAGGSGGAEPAQPPAAAEPARTGPPRPRGSNDPTTVPPPGPVQELPAAPGRLQLRLAFVPLVTYASNVGLQIGGALLLYRAPPAGGARRDWLALGASYATRGPRSVEAKGEALEIFGTRARAFYQLKYSSDDQAPYWGEGAHLAPGDSPGAGSPPDAYRYRAVGPWVSLRAGRPLGAQDGPWWLGGRVRFRQLDVLFPGAALEAARPPGFSGGVLSLVHAGAVRNTRDEEVSPTRGTLADASVFAAPPGVSSFAMWGFNVGLRGYRALAPHVVLAARAMYELKLGEVPFWERTQLEGLNYGEGLGGPGTIRGVARARIAGEEKILGNVELRTILLTRHPYGRPLDLGVTAGADAGRGRQRGHTPVGAVSGFAGLRMIWDHALVLRFEAGNAGEGMAYYVSFDESF